MAPLKPTWTQPSHPSIQTVVFGQNSTEEFTSKSLSTINRPPFALYAKMSFPPCTLAPKATYATVQCGKAKHLNLNSDLVYINHSCEPSVIFETSTLSILAGPAGLKAGQELTFFYPSTEWDMAQGFDCLCGTASCKGFISGAKDMKSEGLEGMYLNGHIRELLEERDAGVNGKGDLRDDVEVDNHMGRETEDVLKDCGNAVKEVLRVNVNQSRMSLEAAEKALEIYTAQARKDGIVNGNGEARVNNVDSRALNGEVGGYTNGSEGEARRGVTSREMSGEMGGDTKSVV